MTVTKKSNGSASVSTITIGKEAVAQIGTFNLPGDEPWSADITIKGTASYVFHRYIADEGDGPAAKKGSNKHDIPENYVYRCEDGTIGVPSEHLRQALIKVGKYHKDPRSARASAIELFKAGIIIDPEVASLGQADWDYLDRRGAVVNRGRILRVRPAFSAGWEATFNVNILLPEYISPSFLMTALTDAGRLIGLGEMRPTFGRFVVVKFEVNES